MDCSMPVMNGYEASDHIREFLRKNNIYQPMIVACTGHTEDEYLQKAWAHQIDEVIQKPTNVNVLKDILKEIICINNE